MEHLHEHDDINNEVKKYFDNVERSYDGLILDFLI